MEKKIEIYSSEYNAISLYTFLKNFEFLNLKFEKSETVAINFVQLRQRLH